MKGQGFNILTVGIVTVLGIYSGTKFFEPLVIESLEKEGNLRSDIPIPEYDSEGKPIYQIPRSLQKPDKEE